MSRAIQFLKKNYEKVLLGLVLFGLVVAAAFLPFRIASEKEALKDFRERKFGYEVKPLPPLSTNRYDLALKRVVTPLELDFSSENKLFNPVRWLKAPDNRALRSEVGDELKQLEISKPAPLYTLFALDTISVSESGARYKIDVEQQAAPKPQQRGKKPYYVSLGDKKDLFTLREVQGPADNPTALVLELSETADQISVAKDKPFRQVEGYMVDLRYPPESKNFPMRRVGDKILIGGEEYNIVAITENEVVLSARSNGKKYTIRYNAPP